MLGIAPRALLDRHLVGDAAASLASAVHFLRMVSPAVEDLVNEEVYKTHPSGFIGLQIHAMRERELAGPLYTGSGVTASEPLVSKWRKMRIRLLPKNE